MIAVNTDLCQHVKVGVYPFQLQLCLDEHLGMTDALVTCTECDKPYLLEMLDWRDNERFFGYRCRTQIGQPSW